MCEQRSARNRIRGAARKAAAVAAVTGMMTVGGATPAHASLLGGLGALTGTLTGTVDTTLSTVTSTVGGLVGVLNAGWDDGATTAPTTLKEVRAAIGADQLWARGYDGTGIGIAQIDSGVA